MDLRVLFIEDDETIAKNLKKIFDNEVISGHTLLAESITSFDEGMAHLARYDYDIVVLDLQKEGKNFDEMAGVKILDSLKKIAFIPVIFYTGHASKIQDLISEIVGVVSKGDGVEYLKAEMQRIIDSKIALLKGTVYFHLKESLRQYFWETVDSDKKVFVPGKSDVSLGYLLLRRFANSLSKENIKQILGDDKIKTDKAHPMEFYIFPSGNGEFEAGEILFRDGVYYAVLTPSCDFIEDKAIKRDRRVGNVLLCLATPLTKTDYFADYKRTPNETNKVRLAKLIESRKGDQFFFLPSTPFIENLILDFQNKVMVDYSELKSFNRITKLDDPYAQSMVSSFIRYYNRIGFPDIDSDYVISKL